MDRIHVGKLLRKLINETRLTQIEVAEQISMSPQGLNGVLKKEDINTDLLWKFSKVLNINLFQIIAESGKTEEEKDLSEKYNVLQEPSPSYETSNNSNISVLISVDAAKASQIMKIIGL